jgi:predicted component of type VI protein secretion system
MSEATLTWPDLAANLYDKLTGRGAEITYQFENMEIFVPSHVAENAQQARWKLNGTLRIRTRDNGTAAH